MCARPAAGHSDRTASRTRPTSSSSSSVKITAEVFGKAAEPRRGPVVPIPTAFGISVKPRHARAREDDLDLLLAGLVDEDHEELHAIWSLTPAFRRIAIIGHHLVKADWKRFRPTKAVKR